MRLLLCAYVCMYVCVCDTVSVVVIWMNTVEAWSRSGQRV